jgi:hypothetical protein
MVAALPVLKQKRGPKPAPEFFVASSLRLDPSAHSADTTGYTV